MADESMSLAERLQADIKQAMRDRAKLELETLRLLWSAIQNEEKAGATVDDALVFAQIRRAIKARREAAEQFRAAGRDELAQKEDDERAILEHYLPAMLGEAETKALVDGVIADLGVTDRSGKGKVMGRIMGKHRDEVDGALVKRLVDAALDG